MIFTFFIVSSHWFLTILINSYVSYSHNHNFKLCILFPQFQAYVTYSHNFKLCILFPQFQTIYPIPTISNYISYSHNFNLCILFPQFQAMYPIPTISSYIFYSHNFNVFRRNFMWPILERVAYPIHIRTYWIVIKIPPFFIFMWIQCFELVVPA